MIRNLKALGLSLVAVCAMGALSASTASATDFFTNTGDGPALMTGVSHDNVFETAGGAKFECTTSRFAATAGDGSSEATVEVEYSGTPVVAGESEAEKEAKDTTTHCKATGGQVTIDMNGCHYMLTGSTTGDDPTDTDATVWITCPQNQVIKITQPGTGVTITVAGQTPTMGGVVYHNLSNHPGGAAVQVTATVTGVAYTCHGFACHFGPGTSGSAKYTGSVTVTGWEDLEGLPTSVKEGARVGISVT